MVISSFPILANEESPALVLVIVVDQLRRDRLDPELPGGMGRIARFGRVYAEAVLDHGVTSTCPGHQTILSGRHPGPGGVVANSWTDRESGNEIYCVEDSSDTARVLGGAEGRSPALLKVDTLGDWMKSAWPDARVFTVAGKDRAAITLGGKNPDAAYWLYLGKQSGFTTSRFYRDTLPDWVKRFNGTSPIVDGFAADFPDRWLHDSGGDRPDSYASESNKFGRSSGHPLRGKDLIESLRQIWSSPYLDDAVLDFARTLVVEENLGMGPKPDLLAISLSATDSVGHLYGPFSSESRASMRQMDKSLGEFLEFLDKRFGNGRVMAVLTSDHGVLPIPEWLTETGKSECPLPGGRQNAYSFFGRLLWHLQWKFGPLFSIPGSLVKGAGGQITVNRGFANKHHIDVDDVIKDVKIWLEKQTVIRQAWTHEEIMQGTDQLALLYRHSFDPERSGDLIIQFEPTCIIKPGGGTTHGSPYEYDRAVPIVFYGPWFERGSVKGRARTIDIAPTLAAELKLRYPDDVVGQPLH